MRKLKCFGIFISCHNLIFRVHVNFEIRCLAPEGIFLQITFAQPHFRLQHLAHPRLFGWNFEAQTFGVYYVVL